MLLFLKKDEVTPIVEPSGDIPVIVDNGEHLGAEEVTTETPHPSPTNDDSDDSTWSSIQLDDTAWLDDWLTVIIIYFILHKSLHII
jgi:hypothetical protein